MRSIFDAAAERVPVPQGDVGAVVQRGGARRRGRIAARVASLAVVVAVGGGAVTILGGQDTRPVPARPGDVHQSVRRLVPVVMDEPPSDVALADDVADARAATVAFHAFLSVSGRELAFGYEDLERSGETWQARFVQVPPLSRIERRLRRLELEVVTVAESRRMEHLELGRRAERLGESKDDTRGAEARSIGRHMRELRREMRRLERDIRRLDHEVAEIETRQRQVRERMPSYTAKLTIVERDGRLVVDDVATDSPEAARLRTAIGYAEEAAEVDVWGNDYYDARFVRERPDGVHVELRSFWTGPLSSAYQEMCYPEVVDRSGRVVHNRPHPSVPPDVRQPYFGAPPNEDRRDGGTHSFGFEYEGDVDDLELRMQCMWRIAP